MQGPAKLELAVSTWWLWLSLAGNVVLIILLFFKSALNDILREAVARRSKDRDRLRELLVELHSHMEEFPKNYFMVLVATGSPYTQPGAKILGADEVKATNAFLSKNELWFPPSIRTSIGALRVDMLVPGGLEGIKDGDAIMLCSGRVDSRAGEIKAEAARLLWRLRWRVI